MPDQAVLFDILEMQLIRGQFSVLIILNPQVFQIHRDFLQLLFKLQKGICLGYECTKTA